MTTTALVSQMAKALRSSEFAHERSRLDPVDVAALNAVRKALTLLREHTITEAEQDVLAERERQKTGEGWTPAHDDDHNDGEMAAAGAVYALTSHQMDVLRSMNLGVSDLFPEWPYKPKDRRRDLVRAAALILAEIERMDRATAKAKGR